ncbi:hypothetical protein S7711_10760 [Stachybotrys chartarum IBT 7711]|uniref:Uncharacterized protein n=1 Tax=Stachybotrys chartarum (strain CBS 109288 / IBT 7711) TaxID=1280523 RepID=A0A084AWX5_STACB|nr:hypothetical protein S7711_10760 [Stachybotrys chartarum IBT 7711]
MPSRSTCIQSGTARPATRSLYPEHQQRSATVGEISSVGSDQNRTRLNPTKPTPPPFRTRTRARASTSLGAGLGDDRGHPLAQTSNMDDGETQRKPHTKPPRAPPLLQQGSKACLDTDMAGVSENAATNETDPSQIDDEEDIRDLLGGHLGTVYCIILIVIGCSSWVQKQTWISPRPSQVVHAMLVLCRPRILGLEEKFSLLLSDWSDQALNWHIRPGQKACTPPPQGRRTTMLPCIVPPL